MKTLVHFGAVGALITLLNLPAFAQGTAFTYQGRLNDGANPARGSYDLRFALYDAASGGSPQGNALTNHASAVSNGLFTVTLDFGDQFPGAERWLEMGVQTNGGSGFVTLAPRQPINATPYAVRAGSLSGMLAASQLTGAISSNNIGAGSITTVMLAAGAVGASRLAGGAVTTGALADGAVTAVKVATSSGVILSTTFANPTPAVFDCFGSAVAAVGNDQLLIGAFEDDTGAPGAGAAYLFTTAGTLLTTVTNPTPAAGDHFGHAVAAVGNDQLLIGAYSDDAGASGAGAAYRFSTAGTLLTTFTNPTPATFDAFGWAVATVGSDRVLISAIQDSTGAGFAGAAYLFSLNGTLLTTITNPTPATSDFVGNAVAAVGGDRLLVGAYWDDTGAANTGAAYMFSTNGFLLATFTNPAPAANDQFGWSVAAVGSDRVLIGANLDDMGATNAGAAYLFSTNGTLLTTFTNPAPAVSDQFGYAVAAMGNDRVLVAAYLDDAGAPDAGTVYMFSTNGNLLATFNNPAPADNDQFGVAVAAVGSDRVFIGAVFANSFGLDAGAAYLFSLDTYAPGLVAEGVRVGAISTASLAANAVTSAQIADGSISGADLSASLLNGTFWNLGGNPGTTPGTFLGTTDDQPLEFKVNGGRALRLEPNATSPNLIGGSPYNVVSNGFVGAVIGGGGDAININRVGANFATVVGGGNNTASGPYATAMGGGSVASGQGATAMGASAQALGPNSTAMGYTPVASGESATAMGFGTSAIGDFSTAMGASSIASGPHSLAAGYLARAAHPGAFVWADASLASPFASTANNQFLIRAAGGVGINNNNPNGAALAVNGNVAVAGTVTATAFSGNGAGLTNLPVSAVVVPPPGMVLIPAGAFTMGDTLDGLLDATPVSVSMSAFYMDLNEVTLSKWHSVHYWAADHGYNFVLASGKTANHPVQVVSWYDCVKWCNARSEQAGKTPVYYSDAGLTAVYRAGQVTVYANWAANGYRLPTEAEWEKAARGGQSGQRFPWSNWINQNLANYFGDTFSYAYDLGPVGYNPIGNYPATYPGTSPVGSFAANGYGLNDMAGNVQEWCWDRYGTYAGGGDPHGPAGPSSNDRVFRGGGWDDNAVFLMCAYRNFNEPTHAADTIRFRCVRGL
jgi:formylglycine-generating enzyme required for sulfatase activity